MPGTDRGGRVARENLADRVFEAVKRDIVENRLRPDEILVEGALADRFAVSRAPAREALQRLRRTGLVRAVPRLGYIVTSVSLRDYDEVFQMRLVLEPLATELATSRLAGGQADIQQLQRLADEVADVVDDESEARGGRLAQVNAAFHREIARMSGNHRLERTIGGLIDELERVMHVLAYDSGSIAEVRDEHPALVRVMKVGDPAPARELMHDQLMHAYTLMRAFAVSGHVPVLGSGRDGA